MRCGSFAGVAAAAAAAVAVALSYWTRIRVLDCGDSDFYGIAFLTLGEAWRGEAWRGVFWTLVGLRDDELPEFSFDGRGRGREGGSVTTWLGAA